MLRAFWLEVMARQVAAIVPRKKTIRTHATAEPRTAKSGKLSIAAVVPMNQENPPGVID
jgi:hypothetical protein